MLGIAALTPTYGPDLRDLLLCLLRIDLLALIFGLFVDHFLYVFGALLVGFQRVERGGDLDWLSSGLWRFAGAGGEGKDAKQDRQRFHDGSPAC
jgi:hypothetical protein